MGTLSHPIISLTTAYSHPLLSSEKQYIVTNPIQVRVKRTLGCAVVRDDTLHAEILRGSLVADWERCTSYVNDGNYGRARELLKEMSGRLDDWIVRGRELSEEFHEMKVELMKCTELVLTGILDQKANTSSSSESTGS